MIESFHHVCIETDRYCESLEFYCGLLGFKILHETQGFHGREYNTWLKLNDCSIELQTPKLSTGILKNKDSGLGIKHICFLVKDLCIMVEELKIQGFRDFKEKDGEIVYRVEDSDLCKLIAPEGSIIELRE